MHEQATQGFLFCRPERCSSAQTWVTFKLCRPSCPQTLSAGVWPEFPHLQTCLSCSYRTTTARYKEAFKSNLHFKHANCTVSPLNSFLLFCWPALAVVFLFNVNFLSLNHLWSIKHILRTHLKVTCAELLLRLGFILPVLYKKSNAVV